MTRTIEATVEGRRCRVEIRLDESGDKPTLSISGEEGRVGARSFDSFGQIIETADRYFPGIASVWRRWHLNGMRAGCKHQRAEGWDKRPIDPSKPTNTYGHHFPGQAQPTWNMLAWVTRAEHPEGLLSYPCSTCGYEYGSAWLHEDLPEDVIRWAREGGAFPALTGVVE